MKRDPSGAIILSRRNLLALLHKLDMEGSAKIICKRMEDDSLLVVRAEDDEQHYGDGAAGPMHPETEKFIKEHGGRS